MMVGPCSPFHLGLVAVVCAILAAACLARPLDRHRYDVPGVAHGGDDATARSERSTNLSHITGTARKIQMYVKNRHLQILPDGTVNGTADDSAGRVDYTILQRSSVHTGQLRIQSVATCLFLCMDSCGLLYGSREFTEDCVFNEMIEQHHYNTYSSARYSNNKRTLYLALNKRGQPRKVQVRKGAALGKLSAYTKVLTRSVPAERVEALAAALLRERGSAVPGPQHPVRHHGYHQLCPQPPAPAAASPPDPPDEGRDKFRCRRRKKRKKKRRRCRDGEQEGEQCQRRPGAVAPARSKDRRRCADSDDQQECLKKLQAARKRRKNGKKAADPEARANKKKKAKKSKAKRRRQKKPKEANNGGGKLEQAEAREENQRELWSSSSTTEDSWWGGEATAATPSASEDAALGTEEYVDYPSSSPLPPPD